MESHAKITLWNGNVKYNNSKALIKHMGELSGLKIQWAAGKNLHNTSFSMEHEAGLHIQSHRYIKHMM